MEMQVYCSFVLSLPLLLISSEYIKIRVENFHLIIYANYKTYAKAMLCIEYVLSYYFGTVKDDCLPTYLERKY